MGDVELQQRRDALLKRRGFENRSKVPGRVTSNKLSALRSSLQKRIVLPFR